MTLDPVCLDGIATLARGLRQDIDTEEQRDLATVVWETFLDPLRQDGSVVLEPIDTQQRFAAPVEELGLQEPSFDPVHGLDSGSITPRTFRNGLVVDVAQAAMSATPSDLDLHRARTVVLGASANDATLDCASDWQSWDEEYVRGTVVDIPDLGRDSQEAVAWLALYLAESTHARRHADAVSSLLLLDGPLYPKELVTWASQSGGLPALVADEPLVETVLTQYVRLVESFVERGVPLLGFIKGARSSGLLRALGEHTTTPWANDMALFTQFLEGEDEREDRLRWTNWFVSRLGADGAFAAAADLGIDCALEAEAYEVAFFVIYDPRTEFSFKVELPYAFARDSALRERLQRQLLRDVAAARGPPEAIAKADSLAGIGRADTRSLTDRLEAAFDSERIPEYDEHRWGI